MLTKYNIIFKYKLKIFLTFYNLLKNNQIRVIWLWGLGTTSALLKSEVEIIHTNGI